MPRRKSPKPTMPLVIAFSGGRTSGYMTRKLLLDREHSERLKVVVFCNTGREREETLEFVNECDKRWNFKVHWIEAVTNPNGADSVKRVSFKTADRRGGPFEDVVKKYGIPYLGVRKCTGNLKIAASRRYVKFLGLKTWETALGIRVDETHRIDDERIAKQGVKRRSDFRPTFYPLYQVKKYRITKEEVREWWDLQPFDLALKDYQGNCDLCFLKSFRKLATIVAETPRCLEWWSYIEKHYGKGEKLFVGRSADEVYRLSKADFVRVYDSHLVNKRPDEYIGCVTNHDFEGPLDYETGCFCE